MSVTSTDLQNKISNLKLSDGDQLQTQSAKGSLSIGGNREPVTLNEKHGTFKLPGQSATARPYLAPHTNSANDPLANQPQSVRNKLMVRLPPVQYKHTRPGETVSDMRQGFRMGIKMLVGAVFMIGGAIGGAALGALGGPIGGIAGGMIGAAAGFSLGYKLADKILTARNANKDGSRYQARVDANDNARETVQSLINDKKLNQPLADAWSRLGNKQMRSLLAVDQTRVPNQDQAKRIRQDTFMRVARDIHNGVPVKQAFNNALNYKVEKEDKYQSDLNQWNIGANQRNGISSAVDLYLQNNPANDLNDERQAFFAKQLHRVAHRKNFHNDVAPDQVRIGRHAEQIKAQLNDPVEFQQAKAAHTSIAALSAQLLNNLADNATSQTVLNDLKDLALHAKAITGQDRFYGKDGVSNADDQRQVLQAHARDAVSNMSSNDARQLFLQLTRAGGLAHRLKAAGGDESLNINGAERYAMDRMMTGLDAMLTALAEQGGVVSGGQDILSLHALKPAPDEDSLQETGRAIINASSDIVAQLPNDFVQMLLGDDKEQSDASSIDLANVKYRD